MYTVLIVDDDIEILEYMEKKLPWEKNGFKVEATAVNGNTALDYLKKCPPDLLVTDITMPGISGLDLVRKAKAENPAIESIILTCHESFAYARESVELGVLEYLVKYMLDPVSFEECLIRVKSRLDETHQKKQELEKSKGLLKRNAYAMTEQLLTELVQGHELNRHLLQKKLENSELAELKNFQTVFFAIDDWEIAGQEAVMDDIHLVQYGISNIADEMIEEDKALSELFSKAYRLREEYVILFVSKPREMKWKSIDYVNRLAQIQEQVWKTLKVRISCFIMEERGQILDFSLIFERMQELRRRNFYPARKKLLREGDDQHQEEEKNGTVALSNKLLDAIYARDREQILEQVKKEYHEFYLTQAPPDRMIAYFTKLLRFLEMELWKKGLNVAFEAGKTDTYEGYIKRTEQIVRSFLEADMDQSSRKEIIEVTQYMKSHLREKITCQSMAQMIHMNISYFSKLFKIEMGTSFSDYLVSQRIDKATKLLQWSDLTIEEITEEIGLADMHYFCRLYKKKTGKTPGEMRRKNGRSSNE